MATAAQLLVAVNTAILNLLEGFESAEYNGRSYTRTDLDKLRRMRAALEAEVARTDAGGMRVRTMVPRG